MSRRSIYSVHMSTLTGMTTQRLVGAAELLDVMKIGRTRLAALAARPGFPAPVVVLKMGNVWDLNEVIEWAQATGRTLHLEAPTTDVQAGDDSTP